jgi:probable HAF family extracellular repeat protein
VPGLNGGGGPADRFYSSPVVAASGNIYLAGYDNTDPVDPANGAQTRHLYAITPSGTIAWRAVLGVTVAENPPNFHGTESTPALAANGTIYICGPDWRLHAFNPDGTVKWVFPALGQNPLSGPARTAPVIGSSGWIYVFLEEAIIGVQPQVYMCIFQDNGASASKIKEWPALQTDRPNGHAISSPALGRDSSLYIATADEVAQRGQLIALDVSNPQGPSGVVKKWQYPAQGAADIGMIVASPAIAADGTIYAGVQDLRPGGVIQNPMVGRLIALNPDGTLKWEFLTTASGEPGGAIDSSPAIGADGTIYVGVDLIQGAVIGGYLVALNPLNGTKMWSFRDSPSLFSFETSPAIAPDGKIYVRAGDSTSHMVLYGLIDNGASVTLASKNVLDTEEFEPHATDLTEFSNVAITSDGRIYSASAGKETDSAGRLWGFNLPAGSTGVPFWPSFRGNSYNTGNSQDNKWTTNTTPSLQITELPNLSTGYTTAQMINNAGQICGNSFGFMTSANGFRATRWTPNGASYTITGLPFNSNGPDYGYFITAGGIIVGSSTYSSASPLPTTWAANNIKSTLTLPTPGFGSEGEVFGANDAGVAVGYGKNTISHYHAIRWDAGGPHDMGTLAGIAATLDSYAFAISRRGITVGKSKTSTGNDHGFVSAGTVIVSGDDWGALVTSNDYSDAEAINGLGQVVGTSRSATTGTATVPVLTNPRIGPGFTFISLIGLGGTSGTALAINNRGHIVGTASTSGGAQAAFIHIPGVGIKNLRTMLSSSDQSAWTSLNQAMGINDEGKVVGWGYRTGISDPRSFIITVK